MIAISPAENRTAPAAPKVDWHRYRLWAAVAAAVLLVAALSLYGFNYYRLDVAHRLLSPRHRLLKPSGSVGHSLGFLGAALFLLLFLYPLRKRWTWLGRRGKTRHWLDFHILLGLTAPAIITFHGAFKLQGIAGLTYWIMMAIVLSGIGGRYLYAQIPRRLDAAEMSFQEIQNTSGRMAKQLSDQHAVDAGLIARLVELPPPEIVEELSLWRALLLMVAIDLRRTVRIWGLRGRYRHVLARPEVRETLSLARRQAVLAKKVLFLYRTQRVFHLWHVVHRPFSYSFAVLASLHVLTVLLLGYF